MRSQSRATNPALRHTGVGFGRAAVSRTGGIRLRWTVSESKRTLLNTIPVATNRISSASASDRSARPHPNSRVGLRAQADPEDRRLPAHWPEKPLQFTGKVKAHALRRPSSEGQHTSRNSMGRARCHLGRPNRTLRHPVMFPSPLPTRVSLFVRRSASVVPSSGLASISSPVVPR